MVTAKLSVKIYDVTYDKKILRENFIALNTFIRNQERWKNNWTNYSNQKALKNNNKIEKCKV